MAVRLYPASFREQFGPDMVQLFRDQWREQLTARMRLAFCCKILGDLTSTLVQQHIKERKRVMQNMPKNKLSLGLAVLAIVVSFVGAVAWQLGPAGGAILLICSAVLLAARVVAEWQRPKGEWLRGLAVSILVLLAFSVIMPAWSKVTRSHGWEVSTPLGFVLIIPLFANLLVSAVKPFAKVQE